MELSFNNPKSAMKKVVAESNFSESNLQEDIESNMGATKEVDKELEKALKGIEFDNDSPNFNPSLDHLTVEVGGDSKTRLPERKKSNGENLENNEHHENNDQSSYSSPSKASKNKTKSFALLLKQAASEKSVAGSFKSVNESNCKGESLFIFGPYSKIRIMAMNLITNKYFDWFILLLIGISSVFLAMENPLSDPESFIVTFLNKADIIMTTFFAIEATCKIISYGFIFNG